VSYGIGDIFSNKRVREVEPPIWRTFSLFMLETWKDFRDGNFVEDVLNSNVGAGFQKQTDYALRPLLYNEKNYQIETSQIKNFVST
jgi:hypothetical protein